jgi:hypothetical protein
MSDFDAQIEDLIEFKKLNVKLEEELKQKEFENQKLSKIISDLKKLCEDMKKELNEQNSKIIEQYTEIKTLTKKFEQEIISLNDEHEKQKQKYEEKILELSSYNPQYQESQRKLELESKYDNDIKNKDLQIQSLNGEIEKLRQNISSKETELNQLKKSFTEQLNTEREVHSFQMNDLLSKLYNQNELEKVNDEKIIFEELKLAVKSSEEKNELLYKQLEDVRKEKIYNEIENNKKIFDLELKIKEEKMNYNILNDQNENIREDVAEIKRKLLKYEIDMHLLEEENQKLNGENDDLKKSVEERYEIEDEIKRFLHLFKKTIKNLSIENKLRTDENSILQQKVLDMEQKLSFSLDKKNNNGDFGISMGNSGKI